MQDFKINPFEKFDKQWALLTAGTKEKFNTMTISWGMMGTLWFKPVVAVFVRETRFTFDFLKNADTFTVSFFEKDKKDVLALMGQISGKDKDKIKMSGLNPKFLENGITFDEAKEVFVCKKLSVQKLETSNLPKEIKDACYQTNGFHYMFVGEVVEKN